MDEKNKIYAYVIALVIIISAVSAVYLLLPRGFTEDYCRGLLSSQDRKVSEMSFVETPISKYYIQKIATLTTDESIFFRGARIDINLYAGGVEQCRLDRTSNISLLQGTTLNCSKGDAKVIMQDSGSFLYLAYETGENFRDVIKELNITSLVDMPIPSPLQRVYSSTIKYYNPDFRDIYNADVNQTLAFLKTEMGCE